MLIFFFHKRFPSSESSHNQTFMCKFWQFLFLLRSQNILYNVVMSNRSYKLMKDRALRHWLMLLPFNPNSFFSFLSFRSCHQQGLIIFHHQVQYKIFVWISSISCTFVFSFLYFSFHYTCFNIIQERKNFFLKYIFFSHFQLYFNT